MSSHSLAPTPSAAVRAIVPIHLPSAAVRAAKFAHPLITSGFFSPPISSHSLAPTPSAAVRAILRTHFPSATVRAAKLADLQRLLLPTHFQPLPGTHAVCRRPRSQARSSPAASSPHPFPCHSVAPTPSAAVRAILRTDFPSAAVRAAKLADLQRLLLPTHFQPLPYPRRPQPPAQFSAPIYRPQPSAQPNSLITSGFFSLYISSHSVAPTPSAAVCAVLRTHFPSAAVRAAKLSHHQRLLLQHISSHFLAPTPSAAVCAILRTHFLSAVRAAKLADLQWLLLPTHFQPLPGTHAVRSRPPNSPHPFATRSRPRSQAR